MQRKFQCRRFHGSIVAYDHGLVNEPMAGRRWTAWSRASGSFDLICRKAGHHIFWKLAQASKGVTNLSRFANQIVIRVPDDFHLGELAEG